MFKKPLASNRLLNTTAITRIKRVSALALAGVLTSTAPALAINDNELPMGGNVASGDANFDYQGNHLNVNQDSQRVVIDWNSFNIGQNASTQFNQAHGASAVAVNRVNDINPSQILGALRANGQLIILNTNGVIFGKTAQVDVSGLLVSTGKIDADLFMENGNVKLSDINANTAAKIVNEGNITVQNAGLAAFVAPSIANSGIINARLGKIALASGGDKATVDLYGDGLVEIALDDKASKALIDNTGTLKADGGTIAITAKAAANAVDSVINMGGVVEANTVGVKNGKIVLGATNADIKVSGKINAKGGNGVIDARSNQNIRVTETAEINADAGVNGNGGKVDLIADKSMVFLGTLSARGGSESGNGGSAEISGYGTLGFDGLVDLGATNGVRGTLLLDPTFAIIHSGSVLAGWLQDYVISAAKLALTLANSNVTVDATNFIDVGTKKSGYTNQHWTGIALLDNAITAGLNALSDGPIDVSTWNVLFFSGTTTGNLTLKADTVNFNRDLKLGAGDLNVQANTVNLDSKLYDIDGLLDQSDITTIASTVHVVSPNAYIQQGIYLSNVNGTVNVGNGTYNENVTINKTLKLQSVNGRAATVINGVAGTGALGTVVVAGGVNGVQIGDTGKGFTINGFDSANPGIENAALYFQGAHNGAKIIGNEIIANGDEALVTEWGFANSNFIIDGNVFSGKTYNGAYGAWGTGDQWTVANVPRQLVALNNGHSNLTFTNNTITGDAGDRQLVAIQSNGATVSGNTFDGLSTAAALRVRGSDINVLNNTFDGNGLGYGIHADNVANLNIDDNDINSTGNDAIYAFGGSGTTKINNNDIGQNGQIKGNGIFSQWGSGTLEIDGNTVNDTTSNGIVAHGSNNSQTISDNTVANAGANGIALWNTNYAKVLNNTISDVDGAGIQIEGSQGSLTQLNKINGTGKHGIFVTNTGNGPMWGAHAIDQNTIDNTGDDAIHIQDLSLQPGYAVATITKNVIGQNGGTDNIKGDGIYVSNVDGIQIKGNTISETHSNGVYDKGSGIQVLNSDNVVIGGAGLDRNTIRNSGWDGIRVDAEGGSIDNVMIDNNDIDNVERVGIYAEGLTNGKIWNNIVKNITRYAGIYTYGGGNLSIFSNDIDHSDEVGILVKNAGGNFNIIDNNDVDFTGEAIKSSDGENSGDGIRVVNANGLVVVNNDVGTHGGNINGNGIFIDPSNGALISQNEITDAILNGIYSLNNDDIKIENNTVTNSGLNGILVEGGARATIGSSSTGYKNVVTNSGKNGIAIVDSDFAKVQNNEISYAAQHGVHVDQSDDVLVDRNKISNISKIGVNINKGSRIDILGNTLTAIGNQGIRTEQVKDLDIIGNTLTNVSWSGMQIEGGRDLIISSNSLNNVRGNGIQVSGTQNSNINTNTVKNIRLSGIVLNGGTGTTSIDNNTIDATGNTIADKGDGISVSNTAGVTVTNNKIGTSNVANNIDGNGVKVVNSANAEIKGNKITQATGNGIFLDPSDYSVISGNTISDIDENGIYSEGNSYVTIGGTTNALGNTITRAGANGILVIGGTNAYIGNNKILGTDGTNSGNGVAGAQLDGIRVEGNANVEIAQNTIKGGNAYGSLFGTDYNGGNGAGRYGIAVDNSFSADVIDNDVIGGNGSILGGAAGKSAGSDGIHVTSSNESQINDNLVNNALGHGIYLNPSHDSVINNNTIHNIALNGINVVDSHRVDVTNNKLHAIGQHGIFATGSDDLDVLDNTVGNGVTFGANLDGIHVTGGSSALIDGNTVRGGLLGADGAGNDGIHVENNNGVEIIGNTIAAGQGIGGGALSGGNGANRHGIYVANSDNAVIDQNLITPDLLGGGLGAGTNGIHVESSDNLTVGGLLPVLNGNKIFSVGGDGIYIDGSNGAFVLNNIISNGNVLGFGVGEIGDDGIDMQNVNGSIVAGNIITGTVSDGIEFTDGSLSAIGLNVITNAGDNGINIDNSSLIAVAANQISNAFTNGIKIANSFLSLVGLNNITDAGQDGINGQNLIASLIMDNNVDGSGDDGIDLENSALVAVQGNMITDSVSNGIEASTVFLATIDNNDVSGSGENGIDLRNSALVTVNSNTVDDSDNNGIDVRNSAFVDVSDNTVSFSDANGIRANNVFGLNISDNDVFEADENGINVSNSDGATILRNDVHDTGENGIRVVNSDDVQIRRNHVGYTDADGIFVNNSDDANIRGNYLHDIGDDGIDVRNSVRVDIVNNDIYDTDGDAIQVRDSRQAFIARNFIRDAGDDGVDVENSNGTTVDNNDIRRVDNNGIEVSDSNNVDITRNDVRRTGTDGVNVLGGRNITVADNTIRNTDGDGIQVWFARGVDILDNLIRFAGDDGIDVQDSRRVDIIGNNIDQIDNNGIEISDDSRNVTIADNRIGTGATGFVGGNGIDIQNSRNVTVDGNRIGTHVQGHGIFIDPSFNIDLIDNTINEVGGIGIYVQGLGNGLITLAGNTVNSRAGNTGARFESGQIDLTGAANTFNNGANGLEFDGTDVSLVGDTFGTTEFNSQTGYYIALTNGAMFGPGPGPKILDATQVSFDGFVGGGGIIDPVILAAIEAKLLDFDDFGTEGQIFFGSSPLGLDANEILPEQLYGKIAPAYRGSVTILGLPFAQLPNQANPSSLNFNNLNDITPAAGGEEGQEQAAATPFDLNNLESAAGSENANCWSQVYNHMSASASAPVTFSLSGAPAALIAAEASCGG